MYANGTHSLQSCQAGGLRATSYTQRKQLCTSGAPQHYPEELERPVSCNPLPGRLRAADAGLTASLAVYTARMLWLVPAPPALLLLLPAPASRDMPESPLLAVTGLPLADSMLALLLLLLLGCGIAAGSRCCIRPAMYAVAGRARAA